jgi:hypothetical protein
MTAVSPDRRILKAFYTQYVAVLLIVLVFVVSGFQQNHSRQDESLKRANDIGPAIGAIHLKTQRTVADAVPEALANELQALVMLLKSHDVRATIRVPMVGQSGETEGAGFQEALAYAKQVRSYMIKSGVPVGAVRTVLSEGTEGQAASVIFSSMEAEDEG